MGLTCVTEACQMLVSAAPAITAGARQVAELAESLTECLNMA
jgi:hypothetical protein